MWNSCLHYVGSLFLILKRQLGLLIIAFMLGISNVILEENRMIKDTGKYVQTEELTPDHLKREEKDTTYSFLL